MSKLIENQAKIRSQSCNHLLNKLKYSIEQGVPIHEHSGTRYYYWSDCDEFKNYVGEINKSNIKINIKGKNIFDISTSIDEKNNVVTYKLFGYEDNVDPGKYKTRYY